MREILKIHESWAHLSQTFKERYGDEWEKKFSEFCEGRGIDPEKTAVREAFGYDWTGDILLEGDWRDLVEEFGIEPAEGMHLVGGRAIHPCKTYHPNEWPMVREYLEPELVTSAGSMAKKPFWLDHAFAIGEPALVLAAKYTDGELQYVGQVDDYWQEQIKSGAIKHVSPGFDWSILEKVDGIAPRGINFLELSLLKNLKPGDPTTTVELWEGAFGKMKEGYLDFAKEYKPERLSEFVEAELLRNRTMMFHGAVNEEICKEASQRLEYLGKTGSEPIKIILNSVGGDVYDGLLVFDTIKRLVKEGIPVECEARGLAASMGSIILQAGTKRSATPNTRFLIHEVSSIAWGKTSDIEDEAAEIRKVNDMLKGILAERTGKTPEEIEEIWHKKDVWFSAEEARDFGLIDEIVAEPLAIREGKLLTGSKEFLGLLESWYKGEEAEYPWNQCIADQLAAGYTKEQAENICGSIKARTVSEALESGLCETLEEAVVYVRDCVINDPVTRHLAKKLREQLTWYDPYTCPNCGTETDLQDWIIRRGECRVCHYVVPMEDLLEEERRRMAGYESKLREQGPRTDAERAKAHFGISDEKWDAMTEEEQRAKITALPPRGSAESLKEQSDWARAQEIVERCSLAREVLQDVIEGEHYTVLAYTDFADTFVPTIVRWKNGAVDDFTNRFFSMMNKAESKAWPEGKSEGTLKKLKEHAHLQEKAFADYSSIEDCIAKNGDKEDPAAYCASICRATEALTPEAMKKLMELSPEDRKKKLETLAEAIKKIEEAQVWTLRFNTPMDCEAAAQIINSWGVAFERPTASELLFTNPFDAAMATTLAADLGGELVQIKAWVYGEAVKPGELVNPYEITLLWDTVIECPLCGRENPIRDFMTPLMTEEDALKCPSCLQELPRTVLVKIVGPLSDWDIWESLKEMIYARAGEMVNPLDLPDVVPIKCPICGYVAPLGSFALLTELKCPSCGARIPFTQDVEVAADTPLGWEGIAKMRKQILEGMFKEFRKLRLRLGEAVIEPGAVSPPKMPGYIWWANVDAKLPKQIFHRWDNGHKRLIRQLRALVKEAQSSMEQPAGRAKTRSR